MPRKRKTPAIEKITDGVEAGQRGILTGTPPEPRPVWWKDDAPAKETPPEKPPDPPGEKQAVMTPDGSVTAVKVPLTEKETVQLRDGRRITLVQEFRFEIDGGTDVRVQRVYRGPKMMGISVSHELTPWGLLRHVTLGYPNHVPEIEDVEAVAEAFFEEHMHPAWFIPRAEERKKQPKEFRFMVSMTEMPKSFTVTPIARPT